MYKHVLKSVVILFTIFSSFHCSAVLPTEDVVHLMMQAKSVIAQASFLREQVTLNQPKMNNLRQQGLSIAQQLAPLWGFKLENREPIKKT